MRTARSHPTSNPRTTGGLPPAPRPAPAAAPALAHPRTATAYGAVCPPPTPHLPHDGYFFPAATTRPLSPGLVRPRSPAPSGGVTAQAGPAWAAYLATHPSFEELSLTKLRLVPCAQFKPGWPREWRTCRAQFRLFLGLPFARQHRLTAFVRRFRRAAGFNFLRALELCAGRVTRLSGLQRACAGAHAHAGVLGGAWLLNGRPLSNPFVQLYPGDLLTLATPRPAELAGYPGLSRQRLYAALRHQWLTPAPQRLGGADAPQYLEVDELTQTVSLLYEPTRVSLFLDEHLSLMPYLTVRMYNWKYTT